VCLILFFGRTIYPVMSSQLLRHTHACLVPHCPALALSDLTAVVAADANDWDSVCSLAQLILQVVSGLSLLFIKPVMRKLRDAMDSLVPLTVLACYCHFLYHAGTQGEFNCALLRLLRRAL
jgi:hypothetical protein